MRARISLPVGLITKTSFMLDKDVENPGVGNVERNTAASTIILTPVKSCPRQKTIMMPFVVEMKKDLKKRNIVVELVQDIVLPDGKRLETLKCSNSS